MTTWWIWAAAALALAILEVLAPGFIFLGFAAGAAVVGLLLLGLTLVGSATLLSPPILLLLFAGLSLIAWLILRRVFGLPGSAPKTFDHDINDS